jgi:hypothetical protein
MDGRMRHQEGPDLLRFVGREIVHDDVHLAPTGLRLDDGLQEAHEFRTRVTSRRVAHDLARPRVERRIERQRPVSVVLEAVPFGASWRQRQDRVQPIEGLNRRLLVDTEHHGNAAADRDTSRSRRRPSSRTRDRSSDRVDQCVAPCGGGRRVHVMMRASRADVGTVGFEPRWRTASPARPSVAKRCFHNAIVRELQAVILAIVA